MTSITKLLEKILKFDRCRIQVFRNKLTSEEMFVKSNNFMPRPSKSGVIRWLLEHSFVEGDFGHQIKMKELKEADFNTSDSNENIHICIMSHKHNIFILYPQTFKPDEPKNMKKKRLSNIIEDLDIYFHGDKLKIPLGQFKKEFDIFKSKCKKRDPRPWNADDLLEKKAKLTKALNKKNPEDRRVMITKYIDSEKHEIEFNESMIRRELKIIEEQFNPNIIDLNGGIFVNWNGDIVKNEGNLSGGNTASDDEKGVNFYNILQRGIMGGPVNSLFVKYIIQSNSHKKFKQVKNKVCIKHELKKKEESSDFLFDKEDMYEDVIEIFFEHIYDKAKVPPNWDESSSGRYLSAMKNIGSNLILSRKWHPGCCSQTMFDINIKKDEDVAKYFNKLINDCNRTPKQRFILIDISLREITNQGGSGHANRLLFDLKNHRIYRIEPHGFKNSNIYDFDSVDKLFNTFVENLNKLQNKKEQFFYINTRINVGEDYKHFTQYGQIHIQTDQGVCWCASMMMCIMIIMYPKFTPMSLNKILSENSYENFERLFFRYFEFLKVPKLKFDVNIELKVSYKMIEIYLNGLDDENKKKYFDSYNINHNDNIKKKINTVLKIVNNDKKFAAQTISKLFLSPPRPGYQGTDTGIGMLAGIYLNDKYLSILAHSFKSCNRGYCTSYLKLIQYYVFNMFLETGKTNFIININNTNLDKNIINYPTNVPVQWGWYNDSASNLSVNQVLDINGNYLRIKSRSGFGRGFGEEKFVFPNKAPLNYSSNVKKGGSRKNKSRRLNLKYRNLSKKIMKKTKKYN
jgi:hypothetical protein